MNDIPPDFSDIPPASEFDYSGGAPSNYGHDSRVRGSTGTELVQVGARLAMPKDAGLPPEQWRVLTDAIWPSAKTPESIKLAIDYCRARKLDPFKRPVHIVPMYNSQLRCEVETVWPGISELQTTAARTGEWAGMDEPKWGETITQTFTGRIKEKVRGSNREEWVDAEVTLTFPESCTVTVYRMIKGQRCAFSEPVYWLETYATRNKWVELPNSMWERRSRGQLLKCAKAASLRAAFPEELGSQYAAEEMEGKDTTGGIVIPGTATEVPGEEEKKEHAEQQTKDRLDGLEAAMASAANIDAASSESVVVEGQVVQEGTTTAARPEQQQPQPTPDTRGTAEEAAGAQGRVQATGSLSQGRGGEEVCQIR
jgi:phage recombination protein Bet